VTAVAGPSAPGRHDAAVQGFTRPMNMIQCPDTLVCVDHPGTIDLSRLDKAVSPMV
jgi:hypothetical protein